MTIKPSETELGFFIVRSFWGDCNKPRFLSSYKQDILLKNRNWPDFVLRCFQSVPFKWDNWKTQIWNQVYINSYLSTHCHKMQNDRNISYTASLQNMTTLFCLLCPVVLLQNTDMISQLQCHSTPASSKSNILLFLLYVLASLSAKKKQNKKLNIKQTKQAKEKLLERFVCCILQWVNVIHISM